MAEIKWIKLSTGLPDSMKIKQIRRLPEGDTIALMWIFLMCLAGETNDSGMIYFTPEIPFTDEMLADHFNMDVGIVRVALKTFQRFGMIEIIDDIICLSAWDKWQSVDRLAEIREYNRIKQQESRARKKLEQSVNDMSMTSQSCQDTDIDKEIEKEEEKDVLPKGNTKKKPSKQKHGEFQNVLLTETEHQNLVAAFGSDLTQKAIDFLDAYIEEKGYKSKSHNLAIRRWVIDAVKDRKSQTQPKQTKKSKYDFAAFEKMAMENLKAVPIKGNPELEKEAAELKKVLQENY